MLYHLDDLARERVQERLDEAAAHRAVTRWRRTHRPVRSRGIARLYASIVAWLGVADPRRRGAYRHPL